MNSIAQLAQRFKGRGGIDIFFDELLSARTSFKIGGKASLAVEPQDQAALAFVLSQARATGVPLFVLGGGTNVLFSDSGFDGIVVLTKRLSGISVAEENCPQDENRPNENQPQGQDAGRGNRSQNSDRAADENRSQDQNCAERSQDKNRADENRSQNQNCAERSQGENRAADENCLQNQNPPPAKILRALAGTSMASLVSFAQENALSGLEEFAGLPGTVGGAVFMNARCFEKEISDVAGKITWLEWSVQTGAFVQKEAAFPKSEWQYKKSPFSEGGSSEKKAGKNPGGGQASADFFEGLKIVTAAQFIVRPGSRERIAQKGAAFVQARKDKGHYKFPCAGSVFKNNRAFGRPTGKIIDELGLKGTKIGGAQIAPFHGNIIVNRDGASASDVLALVSLCKARAKDRFGLDLEEEIIVV